MWWVWCQRACVGAWRCAVCCELCFLVVFPTSRCPCAPLPPSSSRSSFWQAAGCGFAFGVSGVRVPAWVCCGVLRGMVLSLVAVILSLRESLRPVRPLLCRRTLACCSLPLSSALLSVVRTLQYSLSLNSLVGFGGAEE